MSQDIPKSVRVRTDDGNEYRFHAIQEAAEFYECNRSDAIAYACDNVPALVDAVEQVLGRDDLTTAQKREIADEFSSRGLQFDVDENVSVEQG